MLRTRNSFQPIATARPSRRAVALDWVAAACTSATNSWLARTTRLVAVLAMAILAGCGADEIRHYKAVRLEQPKPARKGHVHEGGLRLLAAIIPHGERTWFFKLVGPVEHVNEAAEAFDRFLRSIRFEAGKEIAWTAPDGWSERPASEMRYATFQIGSGDHAMELTVVPLPGDAGSLLDNVNRWRRRDLGLEPVSESALAAITREMALDGFSATMVDMTTGAGAQPPGHAALAPVASQSPQGRPALRYNAPDGWNELATQSAFRVASFEVVAEGKRAEVSVSPLAGSAGGLLANVNRWRSEQLGLAPIDSEQLRKDLRPIEVAGSPGHYVELIGSESAGPERQAILGVILDRGDQTWFFKMTGSADLVTQQKSAFEQFVRSVQFE